LSPPGPSTGTAGTATGDSGTVTVQFCQASSYTCTTPSRTAAATVNAGSWSVSLTTSTKLGNGKTYTMRVVQQDAAGNQATSGTVTFSAAN